MMVVGDVNEMFMPLLDGFLCDPVESEAVIDSLMTEIPQQFSDTRETETILLPAIQAGLEALKVCLSRDVVIVVDHLRNFSCLNVFPGVGHNRKVASFPQLAAHCRGTWEVEEPRR